MREARTSRPAARTSGKSRRTPGFDTTCNLGDSFPSWRSVGGTRPAEYLRAGDDLYPRGGGPHKDSWNGDLTSLRGQPWTGRTEFEKLQSVRKSKTSEKFLQRSRTSSQAGYLVFFYDSRMEDSEEDFPVSIIQWKSYRLKRNTVNTLSAECQALVSGIGEIHWQRFLLLEVLGYQPVLTDWQDLMQKIPFTAVTDSKSLYDTVTTTSNAATHKENKRTAIDVTIIKSDFKRTRGRIRWIPGDFMLSGSLTKKMSAQGLQCLLKHGRWSLNRNGCQRLRSNHLLLLA